MTTPQPHRVDWLLGATGGSACMLLMVSMFVPMADFPGVLFWVNAGLVCLGLALLLRRNRVGFAAVAAALVLGLPHAGPWQETGRWVAVGLMGFGLMAALIEGWPDRPGRWPLSWRIALLITVAWLGWGLLSALGGATPGPSFVHVGKLATLALGGLSCGMLLGRDKQNLWPWLLLAAIGMAALTVRALLRLPHFYKSATMPYWLDANFFSAGLALLLPLLLGAALSLEPHRLQERRALRVAVGPLGAFFLIAIIGLLSRGAWMSLLAGGAVLPLLLFRQARQRWFWLLGLGLMLASLVAFWPRTEASTRTVLGRVETLADPTEFSNRERLMRWTCAWRMALDRPILGHGAGSYPATFKNYLHDEGEAQQIAAWFGWKFGAHSDGFTALAETGFVGFGLFWAMLGSWAWVLVRRHFGRMAGRTWSAFALASVATFVVHGLFNDMLDNACLTVWFFVVVGMMATQSPEPPAPRATEPSASG